MQGGTITSGRAATWAVVGAYWISWISSFSYTTCPGVTARLRPTSKAWSSVWLMRPFCTSPIRFARPRVRLSPRLSSACCIASGLVREVRRAHRIDPLPHGKAGALLRLRVELGALHQLFQIARREKIRLPEVVVVGVVAPFLRRKAPVARRWIGQRRGLPGEQARPQLRLLL